MNDFVTNHEQIVDEDKKQVHFAIFTKGDPITYKEASHNEKWRKAMTEELEYIEKNETWKLIDLCSKHEFVDLKQIYKAKLKSDGNVEKYKARVVTKGFEQKEVNFNEMFKLVA